MKNAIIILGILFLTVSKSFAQKNLFKSLSISESDLNTEQQQIYNKLKNQESLKSINFVQMSNIEETLDENGTLSISLPFIPMQNLLFLTKTMDFNDGKNYSWNGKYNSESDSELLNYGSLQLFSKSGKIIGHLSIDNYSYEIYDLTGGIQVFCETNLSLINEHECGSNNYIENTQLKTRGNDPCEVVKTKILVLYTPAAYAQEPDITGKANLAINQINLIWANSNVNNRVELAGVEPLNFIENPNYGSNEPILLSQNATVIALRQQYNAEIVMLITDDVYGELKGYTKANGGGFNDAFCFATYNYATSGTYTFAHEVNHIYGALHDTDPSPSNAHGYYFKTGSFLGIAGTKRYTLEYVIENGQNRIDHVSNPDVKFKGKKTGKSSNNYAAQVRSFEYHVASFYTEPNRLIFGELDVINIDDDCDKTGNGIVTMECGQAPFTYQWFRSSNGINWTSMNSTTNDQPITLPLPFPITSSYSTMQLKCIVTDANNNSITLTSIAEYYCPNTVKGGPRRLSNSINENNVSIIQIQIMVHL